MLMVGNLEVSKEKKKNRKATEVWAWFFSELGGTSVGFLNKTDVSLIMLLI